MTPSFAEGRAPRTAPSALARTLEALARDPSREAAFWADLGPTPHIGLCSDPAAAPMAGTGPAPCSDPNTAPNPVPSSDSLRNDGASPSLLPVTFLAREADPTVPVMVHINSITDNHREDVGPALMPPVPGTSVRAVTYLLPDDLEASYSLVRGDAVPLGLPYTRAQWRRVHGAGEPDPHNPHPFHKPMGGPASVLVMPRARRHPAWDTAMPRLRDFRAHHTTTNYRTRNRGATLLIPQSRTGIPAMQSPGAPAPGLLILFDREFWTPLGLESALARWPGDLPPVLIIDSGDDGGREDLLPHPDRVGEWFHGHLAPWLDTHGCLSPVRDRIVCGQSFGGLAAAGAVVTGLAGSAIAQSASFHYQVGNFPPASPEPLPGDLLQGLLASPGTTPTATSISPSTAPHRVVSSTGSHPPRPASAPRPAAAPAAGPEYHGRLIIQIGSEEYFLGPLSRTFHDAATQAGIHSTLDWWRGGHDYAWWRHGLFTALDLLATERTSHGTQHC